MDDLGFNKIAAATLMTGLLVIGLHQLSEGFFEPEHHAKPGYEIAVSAATGAAAAGGEQKAEGPRDYYTLMMAASPEAGKAVAVKCQQCHSLENDGKIIQGPPLYGVVGRKIASVGGFKYSAGPQGLESVQGNWDYEKLDHFLERPKAYVPGTAMTFIGLNKQKDRADVIAYLRTLTTGQMMAMPEKSAAPAPTAASATAPAAGPAAPGAAPAGAPAAGTSAKPAGVTAPGTPASPAGAAPPATPAAPAKSGAETAAPAKPH